MRRLILWQDMFIKNYKRMWPYIKPFWFRALLTLLLAIPVGMLDAVIAWALKPYMDVMMIEQSTHTYWIPLIIVIFSMIQGIFTFISMYLNSWVGRKISNDVKVDLFEKLMKSYSCVKCSNISNMSHVTKLILHLSIFFLSSKNFSLFRIMPKYLK